jgi:hypothetical protein
MVKESEKPTARHFYDISEMMVVAVATLLMPDMITVMWSMDPSGQLAGRHQPFRSK